MEICGDLTNKRNDLCPLSEVESNEESKTDTWSIKEVADALEKHGLIAESEVEHAEALRSPEESSSADA